MAAVTRVKARPVMPPGYEDVAAGITLADSALVAGDLCHLNGAAGWAPALDTHAAKNLGFAAQNYADGRNDCSIIHKGEMDGFSGLTPGAQLYPSASVAGGLDTTAVTGFTGRIFAVTATRIRFVL